MCLLVVDLRVASLSCNNPLSMRNYLVTSHVRVFSIFVMLGEHNVFMATLASNRGAFSYSYTRVVITAFLSHQTKMVGLIKTLTHLDGIEQTCTSDRRKAGVRLHSWQYKCNARVGIRLTFLCMVGSIGASQVTKLKTVVAEHGYFVWYLFSRRRTQDSNFSKIMFASYNWQNACFLWFDSFSLLLLMTRRSTVRSLAFSCFNMFQSISLDRLSFSPTRVSLIEFGGRDVRISHQPLASKVTSFHLQFDI